MKNKLLKIITILLLLCNITPVLAAASSNKDLKELTVENHEIYFNSERTKYKVVVEKDENTLKINAVKSDSKAKVSIVGADDLKANGNKVVITVTAENGTTKEYVIEAEEKKEIKEEEKTGFIEGIKKWWEDLGIQNEVIIGIAIGLVVLLLLIFIIKKIRDKKIDKTMDKF